MKVRATLVLDYELTDRDAHEQFGAYDAGTVAQRIQTEMEQGLAKRRASDLRIVGASIAVLPVYG